MKRKSLRQAEKRAARELAVVQSEPEKRKDPKITISNPDPSIHERNDLRMKRKSLRQEEKRAARELAAVQNEAKKRKGPELFIMNSDPSVLDVKLAVTTVTAETVASAGETSKSPKCGVGNLMEQRRSAAEQQLLFKTAQVQKDMHRLLQHIRTSESQYNIQAAVFSARIERLDQSLKEERERAKCLQDKLTEAVQRAQAADEVSFHLDGLLEDTKAQMESATSELKHLLAQKEEESRVLAFEKTQALEAQGRAEASLLAIERSSLEMEGKMHREKEKTDRMQKKMRRLTNQNKHLKQSVASERARSRLKSRRLRRGICLEKENSADLERKMMETKTGTEAKIAQLKANLAATVKHHIVKKVALEDSLSKALQASQAAEEDLALSQTSMTAMELEMESFTESLRDQLTQREEECRVFQEEKTQALEAQKKVEDCLSQAQACLRDMEKSSLMAEKSRLGLLVEKMEAINTFDKVTLHALCLDRDWRRRIESMNIQMSQLKEEKQLALTDLHLALSHIQTIKGGCIGRFLAKRAWKKLERQMQKKC